MAAKRGNPNFTPDLLPKETMIEVIKTDKNGKAWKKQMKYGDWKSMKKQPGFVYRAYQIGVSQYKLEN